ncbi:MAG: ATP-grasp domain-containing protein [Pirellula sp.]|jgi:carbamoyl-phosphate synthase large subunit
MKILITGAGSVMGQSIYKALTYMNISEPLEIHFANSDPFAAGRYFSHPKLPVTATPIFPLARDSNYVDFVLNYCKSNEIRIIYAGTQHELEKLTELHMQLPITATIPNKIAKICLDKNLTPLTLEKHSVRAPWTINADEFIKKGFENQPTILKPATSSASRNIIAVKSSRDAEHALSGRGLVPQQFTAQEQLIGPEYTCGVYVDRYSKMIHTICFERTLTPDGATGYGKIVIDERIDEYAKAVGHALVKEGMEFGHINVQLIVDSKGPCLFEINGRLSSTEAPKAHFGYNSCAAYFYNLVLERSYDEFAPKTQGEFLRYYEEVYF